MAKPVIEGKKPAPVSKEFGKQVMFHCPANTAHDDPTERIGFIDGDPDDEGRFPIAVILGANVVHYSAMQGSEVGEFDFIS